MGCKPSKQIGEAADVYCPPPASIAYFDIDKVGEPWLISKAAEEKPTHLPLPVLEKVDGHDAAPKPWSEVSKVLEDLMPTTQKPAPPPATSFDGGSTAVKSPVLKPSSPSRPLSLPATMPEGLRPVSQNSFILEDRQRKERRNSVTEDTPRVSRRNSLQGLPEICPPGGAEGIVLYTTSVRAVRRTFEDCEAMRQMVEGHLSTGEVDVDERDTWLHGEYLRELRELLREEEEAIVPRLFILGRYVGGIKQVCEFNENGRLRAMTRMVVRRRRSRRILGNGALEEEMPYPQGGRKGCKGCGGVRFIPCLTCNGSCKVVAADETSVAGRCGDCNENGLMKCPLCN